MTPMFWRFFTWIWGAIIGTTLFVLLLVIWRNQPPPGLVQAEDALPAVRTALSAQMATSGAAGAQAWLAARPSLDASFALAPAPCDNQTLGPDAAGQCLSVVVVSGIHAGPLRFLPFMIPLLSGMAIAMAAAWALARRFLRPIGRIGAALQSLSHGDLRARIGADLASSEPAIESLGRAFDSAAETLQALTESRSRLFHDISHEIRSPLARLQAETALLRQNPTRLPHLLPRLEQDIARMDRLIDQILTLARLEHGAEMKTAALDLVDLLDPILADAELEAQALGKKLAHDLPQALPLTGDAELLHRAVENILRNAIRHAPEGSTVRLRLDASIRLEVLDQGPGVAPDRLEAIFRAFERDAAGGTGLGLAIAARAVHLHGGTISAENRAEGFAIVVRLPG